MRFVHLPFICFYFSYCFATLETVPDLSWDDNLSLDEAEKRIMPEIDALELKRTRTAGITEEITKELIFAAVLYKDRFKQSLPACKRCLELEMLLILERITEIGGSYKKIEKAFENVKKKDNFMEGELKKIEAEYEKKFKKSVPWWWLCSNEERLKRLKMALKTNISYPDYSNKKNYKPGKMIPEKEEYELGKTIALYEMLFEKQPPEWHCSNEDRLERLKRALDVEIPYLTREEEIESEINLKTEYEKKFGKLISDFELSVTSISLKSTAFFDTDNRYRISMARTVTGAIAALLTFESQPHGTVRKISEIKFDIGEWLDFLNTLNKLQINKWEKKYSKRVYDGHGWNLVILFSIEDDNDELEISGYAEYPPNWNEFMKIMDSIVVSIKNSTPDAPSAVRSEK
ncbi:MAG: hypothetical protein LBH25_09065 [Fibromonadaceae bacterium]|jgi:hypothetical protein|nr:hypothetical protein [Fibromonadaceae bacterium]